MTEVNRAWWGRATYVNKAITLEFWRIHVSQRGENYDRYLFQFWAGRKWVRGNYTRRAGIHFRCTKRFLRMPAFSLTNAWKIRPSEWITRPPKTGIWERIYAAYILRKHGVKK